MPPGQPRSHPSDSNVWIAGDLTLEELDEIGPEPTAALPPSWTPEEYKAQMLRRGVVDACDGMGLGMDGYLVLAEAVGILEKRPNTLWMVGAHTLPSADSVVASSIVPAAREATTCLQSEFRRRRPA